MPWNGVYYNMQHATIDDVNRLADKIEDDWTLCELFKGRRRAKEGEYMVAQTIHAARTNAEKRGKPFSFKGAGVEGRGGGGLVDNGTAYAWLLEDEFFVEDKHEGKTVIYPTQTLINALDEFFAGNKGQ